jgi:hypothetical protein
MIESPDILFQLKEMVNRGSGFFGTFDKTLLPRSKSLELIDMLIESLPVEIEQARKIVAEREDVLDKARKQAGEIIDEAVRRAEKMVDADAITLEARKRSKELMIETDEYISLRLQDLEEELARIQKEVRAGIRAVGHPRIAGESEEATFNLDNM